MSGMLEQLASASGLRSSQNDMQMDIASPHSVSSPLSSSSPTSQSEESSPKLRIDFKTDEDRSRKRQLRLLKNRQSAALSRQRKKEYITDLEIQTNGLASENMDLKQKIAKLSSINIDYKTHIENLERRVASLTKENNDLRASKDVCLRDPLWAR